MRTRDAAPVSGITGRGYIDKGSLDHMPSPRVIAPPAMSAALGIPRKPSLEDLARIANEQQRANREAIRKGASENPTRAPTRSTKASSVTASGATPRNGSAVLTTTPILRSASSITPRELEPLWNGVLWIGKPTLLVGDPGLGKSLVTADVAARVTRGIVWPCESSACAPGKVLMLSAEDDAADTIVPRLIAAGADLGHVTFVDGIREMDQQGESRDRVLSLDTHIDVLRQAVAARRGVRLVIVDPISAFLGRADSHNNAEVRSLLAALGRLAAELRFAVLVVSHLNKVSGSSAVYRITGSLAFVAAARAVFAIARDPDDQDRRLMLPIKSNLGPDTSGYSYAIGLANNDAPVVRWGDERVTHTAEEVLAGTPARASRP